MYICMYVCMYTYPYVYVYKIYVYEVVLFKLAHVMVSSASHFQSILCFSTTASSVSTHTADGQNPALPIIRNIP